MQSSSAYAAEEGPTWSRCPQIVRAGRNLFLRRKGFARIPGVRTPTDEERNAMPRPLIVSIPQGLGRQEARRRLDTGIARLTPELGVILSGLDYHWQNDTLHFTGTAMWQRITGR